MDTLRALGCVALVVSANACEGIDASETDVASLVHVDQPTGAVSNVTPDPTDFSSDGGQRAPSDACEPTTGSAEAWRRDVGDSDPLLGMSVATDAMRNVFVSTARGETRKFDASGHLEWVRPFGSVVAVGSDGAIFVAGTFSGQLQLAPAAALSSAGGTDAFVAKLDEEGRIIFAVAVGGPDDEAATKIAVGTGVVVSGEGLGTAMLDSDGHSLWRRPIRGAVALDSAGDTVVAGALLGTETFGADELTSAGGSDVFVAKLSREGDYLWARRFGDAVGAEIAQSAAVDAEGAVLVGGVVDGAVDFGGGPITVPEGTCPSEAPCKQAGFVLKLDSSGRFVWSRALVPSRAVTGVAADAAGNIYAAGSYPGDAPPYRLPLLAGFDSEGNSRRLPALYDVAGAGQAVATDVCGDVLFAFGTNAASPGELGQAHVAKLRLP